MKKAWRRFAPKRPLPIHPDAVGLEQELSAHRHLGQLEHSNPKMGKLHFTCTTPNQKSACMLPICPGELLLGPRQLKGKCQCGMRCGALWHCGEASSYFRRGLRRICTCQLPFEVWKCPKSGRSSGFCSITQRKGYRTILRYRDRSLQYSTLSLIAKSAAPFCSGLA